MSYDLRLFCNTCNEVVGTIRNVTSLTSIAGDSPLSRETLITVSIYAAMREHDSARAAEHAAKQLLDVVTPPTQ